MLSRMELGDGGRVPLEAWVRVAEAVDVDLFAAASLDLGIYHAALGRLIASGGWAPVGIDGSVLWFDRPTRPFPGLARVQLPAERVIIRLVRTVTDETIESERLRETVDEHRPEASPGLRVSGTVVALRSGANVRRAASDRRLSSQVWLGCLRDPAHRMPSVIGWIWMAADGSRLLPWGS